MGFCWIFLYDFCVGIEFCVLLGLSFVGMIPVMSSPCCRQ